MLDVSNGRAKHGLRTNAQIKASGLNCVRSGKCESRELVLMLCWAHHKARPHMGLVRSEMDLVNAVRVHDDRADVDDGIRVVDWFNMSTNVQNRVRWKRWRRDDRQLHAGYCDGHDCETDKRVSRRGSDGRGAVVPTFQKALDAHEQLLSIEEEARRRQRAAAAEAIDRDVRETFRVLNPLRERF